MIEVELNEEKKRDDDMIEVELNEEKKRDDNMVDWTKPHIFLSIMVLSTQIVFIVLLSMIWSIN